MKLSIDAVFFADIKELGQGLGALGLEPGNVAGVEVHGPAFNPKNPLRSMLVSGS